MDNKEKEVYIYGTEIIFLNGSLLLSTLGISLICKELVHYLIFLLVFCPLRICAGGYHAKSSERCFLISNIIFLASILFSLGLECTNQKLPVLILNIILLGVIWIIGPLERSGEWVPQELRGKHIKIITILIVANLIGIFVLHIYGSDMIYNTCSCVFFVLILQVVKIKQQIHIKKCPASGD